MPRSDPLLHAAVSALRTQRQRRTGRHDLEDVEIARMIGGEWGLDTEERSRLLRTLLAATLKASKGKERT